MKNNNWKQSTECVHAGTRIDSNVQGVNTPIHTSSSYGYVNTEENQYPRYFNTVNQKAVLEKIAALEKAEDGIVFSSGMGAITCVLMGFLGKGDHAIFQKGLYGGTQFFLNRELEKYGITYTILEKNDITSFENAVQPNTKLVYIETPSNPLVEIVDIRKVVSFAKTHQLISIIDNTFASPINQNPFTLGIDIIVHSGTKYLGGHGDICFGAIVSSKKLIAQLKPTAVNFGASLNAITAYLIERSIKTLHLRVERQNSNALKIAEFLNGHRKVNQVYYPGLPGSPEYEIAESQMSGFGGMMSFELSSVINPEHFLKKLRLIFPALSLGGVETIISAPAKTSHGKLTEGERLLMGITEQTLRLSVGVEDVSDLIDDLDQALK